MDNNQQQLSAALLSDVALREDEEEDSNDHDDDHDDFSIQQEFYEMVNLGLPLAVSFFCRMGMASTDSSFVGHIQNDTFSAETYLAAAVLSDMCVNVFITPPLAFNQVLNALVGQAIGSGNPKMAGVWLQQSVFWLSITMLPFLSGFFFVEPILLFLDFPPTVAKVAGTYAKYNVFWPVPNGIYQCMRFYFQAQGLPRPAMYNNMIFLVVNALLNWIFVFGGPFRYICGWNGFGFVGAAISLSISRTSQSLAYFCYMFVYKQHHIRTWPGCSIQNHTRQRTVEFMKQALPNIGTLLFQVLASQATTVLVGRLGEVTIAASSALSTVTIPWSGSLSATCSTISSVRVGYHLGKGNANAARLCTYMVLVLITAVNVVFASLFLSPLKQYLLSVATNDQDVLKLTSLLVPAMLVGTYLNLLVSDITSGVFSGQGKPFLATLLSFGVELPLSIGGVAIYILWWNGNLQGVYWWQAISGGIEAGIVLFILSRSNWIACAQEAQQRQEATPPRESEDDLQGPLLKEATDEQSVQV